MVFGCALVFGVWIAACACSFVCVMCVCLWGLHGVGICVAHAELRVVSTGRVDVCVIVCEWVVWAIIVLCVRVCGLAD